METAIQWLLIATVIWVSSRLSLFIASSITLVCITQGFLISLSYHSGLSFYTDLLVRHLPPVVMLTSFLLLASERKKNRSIQSLLKEEKEGMERDIKEVLRDYEEINSIKENLEKRILKGEDFALKLQEAVSSLATLAHDQIKTRILEIVQDFCVASSVSYYVFRKQCFYRESSLNPPSDFPEILEKRNTLCQLLVDSPEVLTIRNLKELEIQNVAMACPLKSRENQLLGAVIIHQIDFLDLNPMNVRLFHLLCNWSSIELEKSYSYETSRNASFHLQGFRAFLLWLYAELLSIQRGYSRTCLLTLKIPSTDQMRPGQMQKTLKFLQDLIPKTFLKPKTVFFNELMGDRFHLLLGEEAAACVDELLKNFEIYLESQDQRPYVSPAKPLEINCQKFFLDLHTNTVEIDDFISKNTPPT
jgi:hypothetical protein